jgi:formyl-CoA transferase
MNVYKSSDNTWFVIVTTPDKISALAMGIGRADLLKDPRFADPAKLTANMSQLTTIIDETFSSQPIAHWREVLDKAHIPYGLVRDPNDVINDPQLQANNIVVPLEGAGENLKLTISSPIQVHGVTKVPARRAPDLGEHNDEVLKELGFGDDEIDGLRTSGTIPDARPGKNVADAAGAR